MQKQFTVYDSKSEIWSRPNYAPTTAAGIRLFAAIAEDRETEIGRYPSDFTLFETGSFDEYTGDTTPHQAKINLGLAITHIPAHNKLVAVGDRQADKESTSS